MRASSKDIYGTKRQSGVSHDDGCTHFQINEKREMLPKLMSLTLQPTGYGSDEMDGRKSYIRFCERAYNNLRDIYPTGGVHHDFFTQKTTADCVIW